MPSRQDEEALGLQRKQIESLLSMLNVNTEIGNVQKLEWK
jgi:hypothetical protein